MDIRLGNLCHIDITGSVNNRIDQLVPVAVDLDENMYLRALSIF